MTAREQIKGYNRGSLGLQLRRKVSIEREVGMRLRIQWIVIVSLALAQASHASSRLRIDGFSFFHFAGAEVGGAPPAGAEVVVELVPSAAGTWAVSIEPGELRIPAVKYPSGKSVEWKLSAPATGTLTREGGAWRCTIQAPLVAHVDGRAEGIPFPLTFTTEHAEKAADGFVASRQGARMDPQSGYLQLVAVGVNPAHAATAPGKPFYAVLSGHIEGLPAEMSAP